MIWRNSSVILTLVSLPPRRLSIRILSFRWTAQLTCAFRSAWLSLKPIEPSSLPTWKPPPQPAAYAAMSLSQDARDFYRTFSDSSAGGLVSSKGIEDWQLSIHELLCEFKNHKNGARKLNEEICHKRLTALVSVTISFIDMLRCVRTKLHIIMQSIRRER